MSDYVLIRATALRALETSARARALPSPGTLTARVGVVLTRDDGLFLRGAGASFGPCWTPHAADAIFYADGDPGAVPMLRLTRHAHPTARLARVTFYALIHETSGASDATP
jgi:hypothetical protein